MPSDEKTRVTEFPFTVGQDEGTDRSVLPIGNLSRIENARYRKMRRLGKRNGYTAKTSLDSSGSPLGNGVGALACLGPEFCVVDDRFYRRDTLGDNWARPLAATGAQARTLPGRFPEFIPGPVLETTTQESLAAASPQEGGLTYAFGYIWTAEGRALNAAGWVVHVDAVDPAPGAVVFSAELALAAAQNTDTPHVQLLTTANALVLLTDSFTAGTKTGATFYTLTSLAAGFAAPVTYTCAQSAACTQYRTSFPNSVAFCSTATGTPATLLVGYMNVTTATYDTNVAYAVGGNKTLLSIFAATSPGLLIRVGWLDATGPSVVAQTLSTLLAVLATNSITTILGGARAPVLFAERTAGVVVAITGDTGATPTLHGIDIDAAGALTIASITAQVNAEALSHPFTINARPYLWMRYRAGSGLGVATLVRVPGATEYSAPVNPGVWPAQATLDAQNIDSPPTVRTAGPVLALPVPTPLGYLALLNYTRESFVSGGGITSLRRGYLVVPARHRSEGVRYSPSCVVPCKGRNFVASGQPQWVDRLSAYEAGFIQAPVNVSSTPGAGGALTAASTYSWTCVFVSADSSGIERSGTAVPVTVAMGANTKNTLVWTTSELGSRRQVAGRVYRTRANGTEFFFVGEFEATPGSTVAGTFTFIDTNADTDIEQNEKLYTQVGQELDASNVPACTFANTGGQRLWVAGGFNASTWQCSKLFLPHLAPEFADDDAFRGTLPEAITGSAWLDSQVFFTQEGIYIVGGNGPDGSGVGFFTTTRLPFSIGCVDWRSVVVCDAGVFFQSPRGLYLLPRGFGAPIAADQVLDTLSSYPVISSARTDYRSRGGADNSEQVVQWTASDEAASAGVVVTYDLAFRTFTIDTFGADYPPVFAAGWSGDAVLAPATTLIGPGGASKWHPFRVQDTSFSDGGLPISMLVRTGDMRPFGTFAHGVVHRLGLLAELRSACTLNALKTTDRGVSGTSRVYTGVGPDYLPGSQIYLDVSLGSAEQKDVTSLRFEFSESSASEGLAFMGFVIEHDVEAQNFRRPSPADRIA